METIAQHFVQWMNIPIFFLGQQPVTLAGIGLGIVVFWGSLILSSFAQRVLALRLSKELHLTSGMTYAFQRIIHYVIMTIGILLATQFIGIDLGSLAVIFGFLGVGIGFGLQNLTSNFVSGLILLIERPISVGDFITIEGQAGVVTSVNMRATIINTIDNISVIVPNAKFVENQVINWSYADARARIHCPVAVAYGSDIAAVKDTLLSVARNHPAVLKEPAPDVYFTEFGDSGLKFDLLIWTDKPESQFVVRSQINYAIDRAFRDAAITIPFPQRDVHVQLSPAIESVIGKAAR